MRVLPLLLACGVIVTSLSLNPSPVSAAELDKTFQKLTEIEFPHETFQTRHGHHCTLKEGNLECTDGDEGFQIIDKKIKHTSNRDKPKEQPADVPTEQSAEPPTGPQPAILPSGARITNKDLTCGVTDDGLFCATNDGKTWLKSEKETTTTNDGELYKRKEAVKDEGGTAVTFGGRKGHKFAIGNPEGEQVACFIPEKAELAKDPNYITCGAKTQQGLSGQFLIGTDLHDLGTALPLAPYADHAPEGPVEVRRGDVQCKGEHQSVICQTPLGEFQITPHQAGFEHIQPIKLVNETPEAPKE